MDEEKENQLEKKYRVGLRFDLERKKEKKKTLWKSNDDCTAK